MENKKIESAYRPPYFVAASELGTPNVSAWTPTKATTFEGAKRLAAKLPRHLTTSVKVAIKNVQGEFQTLAILEDLSAITRRRPTWKTLRLDLEQASA